MGACCCIFIFRFNRYLLEYSAFFCFLIASRLVSAILVVQDVNAILKHTYNTAVRAQLISQPRDGCMVHPPSHPPFRILRPHMSIPVVMTSRTWRWPDGVKRFTPAVRHIHVKKGQLTAHMTPVKISIIDQCCTWGGGEIWRQNVHNCEEYMSVYVSTCQY